MKALGRKPPTDWEHVEKYPLTAATAPTKPVPVALGISWYTNFDTPERIGNRWYIGRGNLGSIRGGHCICAQPEPLHDTIGWWRWYDQGSEGACVGFGESRMMSLLNRHRYDAAWLYHRAQEVDEWPGTSYDGTSVRAGMDVLRTEGHRRVVRGVSRPPAAGDGISANRWGSTEDVIAALGYDPSTSAIPLLNSWGSSYPRRVFLPVETLDRLLAEDGEAAIPTDR